jgi:NUDIX domain.
MKRKSLLQLLQNYYPTDQQELIFKKQMIDFINAHEDCFERSLPIGHITASAWLLNADHTKALMMHHKKLDRWFQLGGHCDGDSDVRAVAIKEAQEESGIADIVSLKNDIFDIDIHLIPANAKEPEHYHYDVRFLLGVVGDADIVQNSESNELRWIGISRKDLPTDNPSVVRMFHKWINFLD